MSKKTDAQAQARGPVLIESLASLPQFCAPLVKEGEPEVAYGIDFWAVAPSGNAVADYERGSAYAEEAIQYARERGLPIFLLSVLAWMSSVLSYGYRRAPGPLEFGFIERIAPEYSRAVPHTANSAL